MVRWLLAGCSPQYLSVLVITMRFSKSVWTCLLLRLMFLPGDNLHLSWGGLSVKLPLLLDGTWKVCKQNVSPQCFTSSALLKFFAKRCPGGAHTVTLFIYLHVHTHRQTHAHTRTHTLCYSQQFCHWSYKYGKALNVCFPLPAVHQISGPTQPGPRRSSHSCCERRTLTSWQKRSPTGLSLPSTAEDKEWT